MSLTLSHSSTEERRSLILQGPISKTILFLSIPTLMMGIIQSLMPVIDGLFINNILGTTIASAISYSGPIINMLTALSQGLSVAATAMIGQAIGKGKLKKSKEISTQIILFASILGFIMAPFLLIMAFPISQSVSTDISKYVFKYLALNSLVLPFLFLESTYNAIKNANGKPEATFIRMLIMLILKILFNYIFIILIPLGIIGAVLSSLTANISICLWMYFELFVFKGDDKLSLTNFKFNHDIIKNLIRIGIPSMISSMMISLGFFLINREIVKYGSIVLAGQSIASNITNLCFNLPAAFSSAVTTMVSMNVGAGNVKKAKSACFIGCIISSITAIILIIIIVPLAPHVTVLFTRDPEVLKIANSSLNIYIYSVVAFGICMVQQGAFIGLGKTKLPLVTSILRIWLLRYIFILLTEKYLGFYSVFWGNLFSNYATAIISTIIIIKIKWVSSLPSNNDKDKVNYKKEAEGAKI